VSEATPRPCPLSRRSRLPVATSHRLTVWSQPPEASTFPSGEKATEVITLPHLSSPWEGSSFPVATSQRASFPLLPDARVLPSGEKATLKVAPPCTRMLCNSRPVAVSQIRIVPSLPAEARVLPSAESATPRTARVCPLNCRSSFPVARSQIRIVWSQLAETR